MWVNFEVLPVTFGGKTANHGNLTEVTVLIVVWLNDVAHWIDPQPNICRERVSIPANRRVCGLRIAAEKIRAGEFKSICAVQSTW